MYRKSTTYLDPGFWEPDFLCQSLPSKHVGIMRPFKFWKRDKNTHLKVMISHSVNNVEGSVRLRKTNFTYFRENISKNVCLIKNKREKGCFAFVGRKPYARFVVRENENNFMHR